MRAGASRRGAPPRSLSAVFGRPETRGRGDDTLSYAAMLNEILASYEWYDHPEGLKFVETHRDAHRTSGHWLLLPGACSAFHRWAGGDELWYIHLGRVVLHVIEPSGAHHVLGLGTDLRASERPAAVVPADCWQAAELPDAVEFAFGTVVCAPPFSFDQLVTGKADQLQSQYPQHGSLIRRLTR
jgi:predicted cupin superfamily sugar epimerase